MAALSKQKPLSLLSYVNLVHATAGGCGSAFAMTALYPLDTVRTRLQLEYDMRSKNTLRIMQDIYSQEGICGLYSGLVPVIESLYCSNFVYFYTFHALKGLVNKEKSLLKDLLLGIIAGSVNVLATTPLWVVNTRIRTQNSKQLSLNHPQSLRKYTGLVDGVRTIAKQEGIASLWTGCLSSLILVINPAIQFMTYEATKHQLEPLYKNGKISSMAAFCSGAVAKLLATVITYPIQLIQTKQRNGCNYPGLERQAGIVSMLLYIVRLQGPRGLYKGLEAKILQTVFTSALMFVCYEKIISIVFRILIKRRQ